MLKKILQVAGLFLLFTGGLHAQSAQNLFHEAFSAYESGNYEESLRKAAEVERLLGSTNPRLQSLKVLSYSEQGDKKNALLQLERYFNTSPDTGSLGYSEMAALREELKTGLEQEFQSTRSELERKRREELAAIEASYTEQKDLLAFGIAKEAGTTEALNFFLRNNRSESLKQEALKLIEEENHRLRYNELVENGMQLLSQGRASEAKQAFVQAYKLQRDPWLQQQITQASGFIALQAYQQGLQDLYSGNYRNAIRNFKISLENEASTETEQKLLQAEEAADYELAVTREDPELMKAFLRKYPRTDRRNQAEGFLFYYYIRQTEANLEMGALTETEASLENYSAMRYSVLWPEFSDLYYELVLAQAKQLTDGSRKQRMANIGPAIAHYEELDRDSGERYRGRLRMLKWRQREWAREDLGFFLLKTDPLLSDIGFEFGTHDNTSFGIGIHLQFTRQLMSSDTGKEFNFGELDHVKGLANINFTKKVLYPVWLYGGAGYAYLAPIISNGEMGYMDEENAVETFNLQGGVNFHLKPVVLTLGASYPYLSEKQKLQLSLEESPLYITLGAGIGW